MYKKNNKLKKKKTVDLLLLPGKKSTQGLFNY